MAFRNGSLMPGLGYAHYPSMNEEQPSSLSSAPAILRLQQRHQSERRGESPAVVEPTNIEITIGQSKQPQFLKSIDDLAALSAAMNAFKRQYDDLQKHMDYIENAIDSELKSNGIDLSASSTFHPPLPQSSPPGNDASGETKATVAQSPQEPTDTVLEMSSEAQRLCELMCSKGLRKYIITNISDRAKLMEEIPAALKLAKEPAKFVLECIGKFYIQGRRAFAKDSPMIPARQVSLLILESFLLMPDPGEEKIHSSIKDEAGRAAVAWRKRLIGEGGLAAAEQMDARGLLLLVACFGIPSNFRNSDLLDLIRLSGSAEIAVALRRSPFLVHIIPGVVESSITRGMLVEALDLVSTFGMGDRFSASSVLMSFLSMKKESFEKAKRKAQTPMAFKEAIEKQLAALLSVLQCLEAHNLDSEKEIPGWQIKEEMVKLEEDILHINKEMEEKARSISLMEEAVVTNRLYNRQIKRPRLLSPMEMPPAAAASSSSYSPIYRHPSHRDGDRDEISALVSSYLGPPSSFPHRTSLRRSPEYMVPPGGLGRNVSAYEHLPRNSYSPIHGQRLPRHYSPPIHGQHQIPFVGLPRVYRHSPSVERYLGLPNHRSPRNS